ncbi:MAG: integrase [Alphaproteobacteria bacterium CG11_big_fil_rev_8_21_14_0_20_39_49]|nr:MAG: integrase [Alphaproteobacteria bacterium CG11_big_fil_rev_8_21_14_0_20_39_49]
MSLLTDRKIKTAPIEEKSYKLRDGKGLYILIHKNGSKYWRLRYLFLGKESMVSLGTYPQMTLKEARQRKAEIKNRLKLE